MSAATMDVSDAGRTPSIPGAYVQHGDLVRVDPSPSVEVIDQQRGRRILLQQQSIDVVAFQEFVQHVDILEEQRVEVLHDELLAVEFGPTVDEDRHIAPDEVSSEESVVQDAPGVARLQGID